MQWQLYHLSNKFLEKGKNLPQKFGYFHSSKSTSTFLTASWMSIFFQLSLVKLHYLLIDLNEPRFESHTKGKMRETLKNDGNLRAFFVNFWLNQIKDCSIQIKKMKEEIFSF